MKIQDLLLAYGSLIVIVVLMAAILAFLLAYTSSWLFAATVAVFLYTMFDMIKKIKEKSRKIGEHNGK